MKAMQLVALEKVARIDASIRDKLLKASSLSGVGRNVFPLLVCLTPPTW